MNKKSQGLAFSMLLGAVVALIAVRPAVAEEVRLSQPIQAGVLHEGNVDMVVYYVVKENGWEVVATYADRQDAAIPRRLVMLLSAGDDLTFGLPGHPDNAYRFSHAGHSLLVEAWPSGKALDIAKK